MSVYKPLSDNFTVNATANTVFGGKYIRVINTNDALVTVTIANATANVGTLVLGKLSEIVIEKSRTDTLVANANAGVFATVVAYYG